MSHPPRLAARPEAADDDPRITSLMTSRLIGIVPDAPVDIALRRMVDDGTRHLPVMAGNRCLGMIGETDLVRAMTYQPPGAAPVLVGDVCRPVAELGPADRRSDCARLMAEAGTDVVVVVDGTRVLGIVTATDIVRSLAT